MTKTVKFREIPIGATVVMPCGGSAISTAVKVSDAVLKAKKLNSPGHVDVNINPELNDDDWIVIYDHS